MKQSDSLPILLRPSRVRAALYLLFSAVLFAFGLTIQQPIGTPLCLVFSSIVLLLAGVQLSPSLAYLRLTERGFSYRLGRRRGSVQWSEVERFGVCEVPTYYSRLRFVEWIHVRRYRELPSPHGGRYTFGGGSGVLPDSYGMKADELANLMNRLHAKFGRTAADDQEQEAG